MAMDLTDPQTFRRVFEHARAGRPRRRDAHPRQPGAGARRRPGRLPARLAAPGRLRPAPRRDRLLPAHDGALARARPVARGPGRGPRVGSAQDRRERRRGAGRGLPGRRRRARRRARERARGAAAASRPPARGARARLLGRPDRGEIAAASTSRWAPPRAASGSAWRSCARNALHWRTTPRRSTFANIERPFDRRAGRARSPAGWGTRRESRGPMAGGRLPQAPGRTTDNRRRTSL